MADLFSRAWLEAEGFKGFVPFSQLIGYPLTDDAGVYAVLREDQTPPVFLEKTTAGPHKGKDLTVSREALMNKWIDGTTVIYIGKANSLRQRLTSYARQGTGFSAGHAGGRYIWQIEGSPRFPVAWRVTTGDPREEEKRLLAAFADQYGRLPFANLVR